MVGIKVHGVRGLIQGVLCACIGNGVLVAQDPPKVDFARDIQPLLREHCVECHGPSQQMKGFRLDRRRDALPNRVGANGARIVPGDSAGSPLYRRVSATQDSVRMPPSGALDPKQIRVIREWIDQGAEWPDAFAGERSTAPVSATVTKIASALRDGNHTAFARILRENADAVNATGAAGWTPLMYAALYGDAETLRLLLEAGANPNAQNEHGGTALMYASDSEAKTKLLLGRGANPNLRSGEGKTALLIAASQAGSYPVVKLLLEKGADASVSLSDGRGGLTAAAGSHDPMVLQLLLDHGARKRGIPLAQLIVRGCTECFDLLLPFAEPADLASGLTGTVRTGDIARTKALLDRGAKPGANLLQVAAAAQGMPVPPEMVRTFISRGADVNAKTSNGRGMVDFAKRQGNTAMADLLRQAGAAEESAVAPPRQGRPAASPRAAIERVLPALQRADVAFLQKAGCVSCHNNSLTAMTVAAVGPKGLPVNAQVAKDQSRKIVEFLAENAERGLENEGIPGALDTVSYILMGLAADGYPGDPVIDVWARYLKNNQNSDGRFVCGALRPPLESSDFEVTAASIRALKTYRLKEQAADYDTAVARAVRWLKTAKAVSTEDHAFRILGLSWGRGDQAAIRSTAKTLLALQRSDGGWGQTGVLPSDAYATGQALVALAEARVPTGSAVYQKGIQFLMKTQLEDGSWLVQSRAPAIQPYFDSGFPHGTDQFISAAASNWASMALATVVR